MTTGIRWGAVRLGPEINERIARQLADPKVRSAAVRRINREADKVVEVCAQVAKDELNDRPDDRRSPESLAFGKHYWESFERVEPRELGYGKVRIAIRNRHPAHAILEKGAQPHAIYARDADFLTFPYNGPSGLGGPGAKNDFAVAWGSAPEFVGGTVDHPGVGKRGIMARALRRYRRSANKRLNG